MTLSSIKIFDLAPQKSYLLQAKKKKCNSIVLHIIWKMILLILSIFPLNHGTLYMSETLLCYSIIVAIPGTIITSIITFKKIA